MMLDFLCLFYRKSGIQAPQLTMMLNFLMVCFRKNRMQASPLIMMLIFFCMFQEEQNASSSANYDVELLHPVEAHEELLRSGKWLMELYCK